ncbi:DD3-3-like [Brachionus plicatilis]|uniref:DD3-3-like n=1 Tax=Brachionus plicatilis TaxID=10195 RepID=A0A3M7QSY3_BRAPC|nr:DD3-3-like [Brachionus plicatilis]
MIHILKILLFILFKNVHSDIYLHNPRGSNNRLDEQGRERNNANRMFDSQNNNRGGYNAGYMTNQHSCFSPNANCDIIIQYMCDDKMRDGSDVNTIPNVEKGCQNNDCDKDFRFGMNEDFGYYSNCKQRERNKGLFTADQRLRGDTAIFTRQNPNGNRYAYECPEERDYYPYWHPTKWIDIAILTNDPKRCSFYQSNSENVKSRFYCKVPKNFKSIIPITKIECLKILDAQWRESSSHNVTDPVCRETQFTRDNHLGNSFGGQTPFFNWKLPSINSDKCVLRIRYNISTNDYDPFKSNQEKIENFSNKYGLNDQEANKRGYVFKSNPKLNTGEYFKIGKRGNIVQVYPAVEYDFVPNKLEISKNDYIHIQWTGSNKNPLNNDGQGLPGTDRSNIVLLTNKFGIKFLKSFGSENPSFYAPLTIDGDYRVNYPLKLDQNGFMRIDEQDLIKLAFLRDNQIGGSMDELDDAGTYFDFGTRKVTSSGVFHYMSTRNNNFSNRDQKGLVISYENEFFDDFIGWNGGVIDFRVGSISVPEGAVDQLEHFRVDIKTLESCLNRTILIKATWLLI